MTLKLRVTRTKKKFSRKLLRNLVTFFKACTSGSKADTSGSDCGLTNMEPDFSGLAQPSTVDEHGNAVSNGNIENLNV